MTSNMVITIEKLDDVPCGFPRRRCLKATAVRSCTCKSPNGFMPHDVTLVRRSESQAVITGIREGELVAMSNPDQQTKSAAGPAKCHEGAVQMIVRFSDIGQALSNLRAQKTRTVLTALGIVFGVGSVIGMLAIGAGAKEESLALHRTTGRAQRAGRIASGHQPGGDSAAPALLAGPVRARRADSGSQRRRARNPVAAAHAASRAGAAQAFARLPELYGVRPSYSAIHNLHLAEGKFFDERDDTGSAAVCVLGERAKVSLLGYGPALWASSSRSTTRGSKWWAC